MLVRTCEGPQAAAHPQGVVTCPLTEDRKQRIPCYGMQVLGL